VPWMCPGRAAGLAFVLVIGAGEQLEWK